MKFSHVFLDVGNVLGTGGWGGPEGLPFYPAGGWGPAKPDELIARDGASRRTP
jgi:hypothetical protein